MAGTSIHMHGWRAQSTDFLLTTHNLKQYTISFVRYQELTHPQVADYDSHQPGAGQRRTRKKAWLSICNRNHVCKVINYKPLQS